jgi:hypothetical protein
MRRHPANRYQSAEDILADLEHLDTLDPDQYDTSAEKPMGGMAAVNSERRLWAFVGLVAVIFLGIVAVIIALSVLLR